MNRREFIKISGCGLAFLAFGNLLPRPTEANPQVDYSHFIPSASYGDYISMTDPFSSPPQVAFEILFEQIEYCIPSQYRGKIRFVFHEKPLPDDPLRDYHNQYCALAWKYAPRNPSISWQRIKQNPWHYLWDGKSTWE
jgi:hypothetical protein